MSEGEAPDLTGWELGAAREQLAGAGCEVRVVETAPPERLHPRHVPGERRRVVQQREAAGELVLVVAREIELGSAGG